MNIRSWHFSIFLNNNNRIVPLHIWSTVGWCGTHRYGGQLCNAILYMGLEDSWILVSMGVLVFQYFMWIDSFSLRKKRKFLLVYFHTTLIRKVLSLCLPMEKLMLGKCSDLPKFTQLINDPHLVWNTHPLLLAPCRCHTELNPFRKDPLFESLRVVFSLRSLPLWPAALVADCLLSTETCGKHKRPTAIALKFLPFPVWKESCCPVASRLRCKRAIGTHTS